MKYFDGRKIRDQILDELKSKIDQMERQPGLAVLCVGENPVCSKYVGLKKKFADKIGIRFQSFNFDSNNSEQEVIDKIEALNCDRDIDGIMIQMPLPAKFNRDKLVSTISINKDVDGLRYCCGIESKFKPPVVLAIMKVIKLSSVCYSEANAEESQRSFAKPALSEVERAQDDKSIINYLNGKEVVIVGEGFLVGGPLKCYFTELKIDLKSINNINNSKIQQLNSADLVISAAGKAGLIKPDMIKEGVVLIDAGTTEVSGELKGDIDPACYEKASFYTPVPGGIGPITVAMLFTNLVK